ncbi:hypothetical protein DL93DRAFT_2231938 [Clavulina sp. PMI_390]|nr:hypothetical protein DL93DRAFT_2231938 [Clavulina sp. PMI_390]
MDPLVPRLFHIAPWPHTGTTSDRTSSLLLCVQDFVPRTGSMQFPLPDFCTYVDERPSLLAAEIVATEGYRQTSGGVAHRFVLLEVCRPDQNDVWLPLDRRTATGVSFMRLLRLSGETVANDSAMLSGNGQDLIANAKLENSRTLSKCLRLADLNRLLSITTEELEKYRIWPDNCWFFCSLVQQHLVEAEPGPFRDKVQHMKMGNEVRRIVFARYWGTDRPAPPPPPVHEAEPDEHDNGEENHEGNDESEEEKQFGISVLRTLDTIGDIPSLSSEIHRTLASTKDIVTKICLRSPSHPPITVTEADIKSLLVGLGKFSAELPSPSALDQRTASMAHMRWVLTITRRRRDLALKSGYQGALLAEEGMKRFGSASDVDARWSTWLLPRALINVTQAYDQLDNLKEAFLHGRRAAELAREAFRSNTSSIQAAATFAMSLKGYEAILTRGGL